MQMVSIAFMDLSMSFDHPSLFLSVPTFSEFLCPSVDEREYTIFVLAVKYIFGVQSVSGVTPLHIFSFLCYCFSQN